MYNMYKIYLFQDVWITAVRSSNLMIHNVTSVPGAPPRGVFLLIISGRGSGRTTRFAVGAERFGWLQPLPKPQPGKVLESTVASLLQLWALGFFSFTHFREWGWLTKITCNLETVDSMTLQQWCFFLRSWWYDVCCILLQSKRMAL